MPKLIDLTLPVADHFRWKVERALKAGHARGDQFQITWIGWTVHGFTHVDALPLKVPDADGAPARVIAMEEDASS